MFFNLAILPTLYIFPCQVDNDELINVKNSTMIKSEEKKIRYSQKKVFLLDL